MAISKITNAERDEVKIYGLPDKPGLSKEAMQQRFDGLGNLAIDKINEVIDSVNDSAKEVKELGDKVDQFGEGQIPEEYVQSAVETYVNNNQSELATKRNLEELDEQLSSEIEEVVNYFPSEYDSILEETNTANQLINTATKTVLESAGANNSWSKFIVGGNEKIKITGRGSSVEYTLFSAWDSSDNRIYLSNNYGENVVEMEYTTPENCAYIIVNGRSKNGTVPEYAPRIEQLSYIPLDSYIKNDDFELSVRNSNIVLEQKKNDFAWNEYDKAYITFSFDDAYADISDVVTLFHSKNVPCCLAIPYERLNVVCNSSETVKEVCERCISNGGEILGHGFKVLTSASTKEDIKTALIGCKKAMYENGFDIQGFMAVGGTDENGLPGSSANFDEIVEIMRPYYRYSDYYGQGTGVVQYSHTRTFIGNELANEKTLIDTAISNKSWLSFGVHTFTQSVFEEILSYIAEKGTDNVEVVTFATLHDNFGTTKLEKRLNALEN